MDKKTQILQLEQQIDYFKQFISKNRKQQLQIIKQLEQALVILKKQKD